MTTGEAAAKCLALLEHDDQLAKVLCAPLVLMAQLQSQFDPAVRARLGSGCYVSERKGRRQGIRTLP